MLNEDLLRFATFTFSLSSKSGKFSCWSLGLDRWLPSHPPVEVELVSSLPLEGGWGRHPMCHFRELQRATTNLVHLSASRPESFFFVTQSCLLLQFLHELLNTADICVVFVGAGGFLQSLVSRVNTSKKSSCSTLPGEVTQGYTKRVLFYTN